MKKINLKENWASYVSIMAGLALVIVGLVFLTDYKMYYGDMRYITFGADFYTEIHEATARAVNTLRNIYEMLRVAMGTFMVTIGIVDIAVFGGKLKLPKEEPAEKVCEEIEA